MISIKFMKIISKIFIFYFLLQ